MEGIILPPLFPLKRGYRRQLKAARKQLLRGGHYICVCKSWGKLIHNTPLGKDIFNALGGKPTFGTWMWICHPEMRKVLTMEEMDHLCWVGRLAWIEALLNQKRK